MNAPAVIPFPLGKIIDVVQGTPEWEEVRAGKVTASRVDAVLSRARDRKSEGATRRNYRAQIIAEILTGRPQEDKGFKSRAMQDGVESEPFASAAYEVRRGVEVAKVGFVLHPTIARAGCSPDRLVVDQRGIVQFKCPYPATHMAYMLAGEVPSDYEPQMMWEMACTGAEWCDFVSYCGDLPLELQLYTMRLPRNQARIDAITAEVTVFLKECDDTIKRLTLKKAA